MRSTILDPTTAISMSLRLSVKGLALSKKPGSYRERAGRTSIQMNEGSRSFGSQSPLRPAGTWQHVCGHPLICVVKYPPGGDRELVGTEAGHEVVMSTGLHSELGSLAILR